LKRWVVSLVLILVLCLASLFPASAIPTFYSGGIEDPDTWTRLLDTDTSLFWSQGDFFHSPGEADHLHRFADVGVKINYRPFWWWKFYNGEIAWNASVADFYYNATLLGLLEEYIDQDLSRLDPEKVWAVTLSEEEPGYSLLHLDTPQGRRRHNESYHSETGLYLRDEAPLGEEKLVYDAWVSEKWTWLFNHLHDHVKERWPHVRVFQFVGPWPAAPPVWTAGIDVTGVKADGYVGDLYYYEAYDNPLWLYEFVRQHKASTPGREYHLFLWGEEPWPEGGLAGGFEHIRRNAWVAYLAGVDAVGWFNWHYELGNMWERDDALGKRLFAYTNRLNRELSKLPPMNPEPRVLVIRDQMMSFQIGLSCDTGLFNEWDAVNQRTLASEEMNLSQYKLIIANEDRYSDAVVEKLNEYVRAGGNLVLLGGFGWERGNLYGNATRAVNFLNEENVGQEHVSGDIILILSEPNPLNLTLNEHLQSSFLAIPREDLTENHRPIGEFFHVDGDELTETEHCPLVLYHNSSNPEEGSILYWGLASGPVPPVGEHDTLNGDVVEAFIPELNYTRYLYRAVTWAYADGYLRFNGSLATTGTENMIVTQSETEDGAILAGVSSFYPEPINYTYALDLDRFGLPPGEYWVRSLDEGSTLGRFQSRGNLLEVPLRVEPAGTRLLLISEERPAPSYSVDVFPDIPTPEEVEGLWLPELTISSEHGNVTGGGTYEKGATVTFGVHPTEVPGGPGVRHVFTGWDSASLGGYTGPLNLAEIVIENDVAEVARWETQYYLSVEDGVGGSETSSGWHDPSTEVTISASPTTGFEFAGWVGRGPGSYSGPNSSHTITIDGPISETPVFLDVGDPTAYAGYDRTGTVGEMVIFDAVFSSDNVGVVHYGWDFGDGTTATFVSTTHVYDEPGTYTVTLRVRDGAGNSDTDTVMVTVTDGTDSFQERWGFPMWILYFAIFFVMIGALIFLMVKYS